MIVLFISRLFFNVSAGNLKDVVGLLAIVGVGIVVDAIFEDNIYNMKFNNMSKEEIEEAVLSVTGNVNSRAEELSIQDFAKLSNIMKKKQVRQEKRRLRELSRQEKMNLFFIRHNNTITKFIKLYLM